MSSKAKVKKAKKVWKPDPYLFAAFRRVFRWSPERRACLEDSKNSEGRHRCKRCSNYFAREDVAVDHIDPVVAVGCGFVGWDAYANRLFCPRTGLQVLCKGCHKDKSKKENALRREAKKGGLK